MFQLKLKLQKTSLVWVRMRGVKDMKRDKNRIIKTCSIILSFILTVFISIYQPTDSRGIAQPVFQMTGHAANQTKADIVKLDPIKHDEIRIIPGGQSIGVQLETLGVLVVGHHSIQTEEGILSPGQDAKVLIGDMIVEVNGKPVRQMNDLKIYVNQAGKLNERLNLTLKRDNETIRTTLRPILDRRDNQYKIGLYIRDSAAGIGTMTFYEPESKRYGALGHVISDMDTKKPIDMVKGKIVRSSVVHIEKGNQGAPGEKQARFSADRNIIGNIVKNTPHGIFGVLDKDLTNGMYDSPLPITRADEVKEGPAKILTVVDDEKVEEFDIEIVSSVPQKKPDIKGMVIKITDQKLLEKTGGIVQGMSGSPIIQEGKIVGAVTHVFVNDPTSGYAVHIEWMLKDAGLFLIDNLETFSYAS